LTAKSKEKRGNTESTEVGAPRPGRGKRRSQRRTRLCIALEPCRRKDSTVKEERTRRAVPTRRAQQKKNAPTGSRGATLYETQYTAKEGVRQVSNLVNCYPLYSLRFTGGSLPRRSASSLKTFAACAIVFIFLELCSPDDTFVAQRLRNKRHVTGNTGLKVPL